MTETQIIIMLDIIIACNVAIQGYWIILWLEDRKKDKTNKLLQKQIELLDSQNVLLATIRHNTNMIKNNTYKK